MESKDSMSGADPGNPVLGGDQIREQLVSAAILSSCLSIKFFLVNTLSNT